MTTDRTKTAAIAAIVVVAAVAVLAGLLMSLDRRTGPTESTGHRDDSTNRNATGAVDLEERIAHYTSGFGEESGYRRPTGEDRRAVAQGVGLFLDGRRRQAEERLSDVDFEIRTITDSITGRQFAEITDRTEEGPAPRGWGRVYVDLATPAHWSVQVPHPVADRRTEFLGVNVLRGTSGGVLVIAGAHRRAGRGDEADVAHRTDSVFDAVCDELTERRLPGIQLHGYADESAPDYDVIASAGEGEVSRPEGRALADALRARDFDVCRAWVHDCPLEGRSNVQGHKAEREGVPFLHIEFSNTVRMSGSRAGRAAEAVRTVTAAWSPDPARRPAS
ncbi:hypothetical protein ACFU5O_25700 [Streptomyces sp. NPDC057445]|uniref:hypothetical protein n=1 Tax=Streptomyces sp. NPDC057445 TaxID=3346136 RepID=UPI00368F30B4